MVSLGIGAAPAVAERSMPSGLIRARESSSEPSGGGRLEGRRRVHLHGIHGYPVAAGPQRFDTRRRHAVMSVRAHCPPIHRRLPLVRTASRPRRWRFQNPCAVSASRSRESASRPAAINTGDSAMFHLIHCRSNPSPLKLPRGLERSIQLQVSAIPGALIQA